MIDVSGKEAVNLYISIPSNRDWKPRFAACHTMLTAYLLKNGQNLTPKHYLNKTYTSAIGQASCLSIARQSFVDEMIAGGYTHWLALDDDMTFPDDIVSRLLSHDVDVAAVNARHKKPEVMGSLADLNGRALDSTGKTGLEEIMLMGGAIFLAKVSAFKNIPRPHFQVLWSEAHQSYVSEDYYFAALLRSQGARLWCDHDASQEIGHIGDHEYKFPKQKIEQPEKMVAAATALPQFNLTPEQLATLKVA